MDRRTFLGTLSGGLLAGPLAAEAQQTGRMYRIGYLGEGPPENALVLEETLRELGYLGYVAGRNLVVERRFAAFKYDRLPDLAAELVRLKPDVLVTGGNPGIAALRQATATVPIVMAWASDPVGAGLVTSLARPGGNITGRGRAADEANPWVTPRKRKSGSAPPLPLLRSRFLDRSGLSDYPRPTCPTVPGSDPLGGLAMQCPGCQHENPSHAKFCMECGTPLRLSDDSASPGTSYADLEHALNAALEQQTATSNILNVISVSPTALQPVLDAVVESAARFCGADDASLFRLDGDRLRGDAHYGPVHQPADLWLSLLPGTVGGRTMLERRTIHVGDLQAETEDFPEGSANARKFGFRTTLSAPLVREGTAIGVIQLRRAEMRPFTDKQIALLQTFVDQAVIAIENVRLFKELEARNCDLTATSQIPRVISSSPTDAQPAFDTIDTPVEHLELATVLKVSQAVSGEIVLEKLVETLLRTATEHAGAQRGLLILRRGDELSIEAEANTSGSSVVVRLRETPVSAAELPESVVRYAARTQESVILDDASTRNPFSTDEYIRRQRARSVLCLPLVKQGTLLALLYLENDLAPNVFTPGRMAVLKVLASGAAMSLENSRLYRELQEREAKIRRLVDSNIIGVVIATREGAIIEANGAFLDMIGYSRDDLVAGRLRWAELTPAEWRAATERAAAAIRATGRCDVFEKEYIRRDGSRVPVLVGAAAFVDTRARSVSFVVDLSERKRSEEALQRAHAELAHVTRVTTLGELAASIAHEVNQPLAAIVADANACLNWLAGTNPRLDMVHEALAAMVRDGHRAADVIQRIRQLAVKAVPPKAAVDLNDVVREVLPLVRAALLRHEVSLAVELASELPRVLGDRVQLQQVILNLVLNGTEAMAGVEDRPRELTIRSQPHDGEHVTLAVHDTGVGIDPNHLDRLFNAFFTTKPGGMGMGLSISRSIVEAHGGRLSATANEPHGAIFHVSLPIAPLPLLGDIARDRCPSAS
jgi:PAS domain S-box-containing protein